MMVLDKISTLKSMIQNSKSDEEPENTIFEAFKLKPNDIDVVLRNCDNTVELIICRTTKENIKRYENLIVESKCKEGKLISKVVALLNEKKEKIKLLEKELNGFREKDTHQQLRSEEDSQDSDVEKDGDLMDDSYDFLGEPAQPTSTADITVNSPLKSLLKKCKLAAKEANKNQDKIFDEMD